MAMLNNQRVTFPWEMKENRTRLVVNWVQQNVLVVFFFRREKYSESFSRHVEQHP